MSFKLLIHACCTQKSWHCLLHFLSGLTAAPNGHFGSVLGAGWSRVWNKWFPTKEWIERGSDCEGSPNHIWKNAHWLAGFTWNREPFFFLWQKVWWQFLYWEIAYCLIHIFKLSTELMKLRNVSRKGLLPIVYSNLPSETGPKPTFNWASHGFVPPSLINHRGRQVPGLSVGGSSYHPQDLKNKAKQKTTDNSKSTFGKW